LLILSSAAPQGRRNRDPTRDAARNSAPQVAALLTALRQVRHWGGAARRAGSRGRGSRARCHRPRFDPAPLPPLPRSSRDPLPCPPQACCHPQIVGGRQAAAGAGKAPRKSMAAIMSELVAKALDDYDQACAAAMGARVVRVRLRGLG
jgi:hypothetical protein